MIGEFAAARIISGETSRHEQTPFESKVQTMIRSLALLLLVPAVAFSQGPVRSGGKASLPSQTHGTGERADSHPTLPPVVAPRVETSQEGENNKRESSSDWWMRVFNGTLAVVAVLQLILLGMARSESKQQLAAMQAMAESIERDQRAYVMYRDGLKQGDGELTMIWANFGRTPATDVVPSVLWSFEGGDPGANRPHPEPPPTNQVASDPVRISLAPGAEHHIHCRIPDKIRRDGNLMYGGYTVFLHGHVAYTDMFGKQRRTDFRFRVDRDGRPQFSDTGSSWT